MATTCPPRRQRRSGRAPDEHSFSGAAAQALMDLGATVCLARIPRCDACPLAGDCPARGTRDEPLRKQSRFEGSFRQRRAATLRLVAASPAPHDELDREAVESLERDGLVVLTGTAASACRSRLVSFCAGSDWPSRACRSRSDSAPTSPRGLSGPPNRSRVLPRLCASCVPTPHRLCDRARARGRQRLAQPVR